MINYPCLKIFLCLKLIIHVTKEAPEKAKAVQAWINKFIPHILANKLIIHAGNSSFRPEKIHASKEATEGPTKVQTRISSFQF